MTRSCSTLSRGRLVRNRSTSEWRFEQLPGQWADGAGQSPPLEDDDAPQLFVVTDVTDEAVVMDANHPLAGIALRVWVKIELVREADEEEIENMHARGELGLQVISLPSPDDTLH